MFQDIAAIACMMLAAVVLWGWGGIASRLADIPKPTAPVAMAIGLAAIVCVGGVLNALRIAHGAVLDGVLLIGLASAVRAWSLAGWCRPRVTFSHGIAALPIVAVALLLVTFIVPPVAFNWYDDLERYLAYPV